MESGCNNEEMTNFKIDFSFENVLTVPLILNQIFLFLDKGNIKCLSLCNKKIYKFYCNQIKELKINKGGETNLKKLIDKYDNVYRLDLSENRNIKDFTPISKLERLELLKVKDTNICDISFFEKMKNIKELNLNLCENIKDFIPISNLERLEILNVGDTNISDISFLEKNKNIKELNLNLCENILKILYLYLI